MKEETEVRTQELKAGRKGRKCSKLLKRKPQLVLGVDVTME